MLAEGNRLGVHQSRLSLAGKGGHHVGAGLLAVLTSSGQGPLPIPAGYIPGNLTAAHVRKAVYRRLQIAGAGSVLPVHHRLFLGINSLINLLMGIVHQADLVIACLQHIAAGAGLIVGGHILHGKLHAHRLRGAGLQQAGLTKAGQHHMSLLDAAHGTGGGVIHLHHVLARHIAGVGHLHFHADGLAVRMEILDGLCKAGVGQPVTKGILHRLPIRLFVAQAGGIVDPAGLVEPVAHIDALGILHIVPIQIGIGKTACIPVSRGGDQIISIGIGKPAGGVYLTAQNLAHRLKAGGAGAADPESGIHAALLHKAQLHGVGGVDQHNHPGKALGLYQFQQILFVLRQLQIMGAVVHITVARGVHILRQIAALTAGAGEHDQRRVGKCAGVVHQLLAVLGGGHLHRGEIGAHKALLAGPLHTGIFIKIHQLLIDHKAAVGQALDQIHVVGGVTRATASTAVQRVHGGITEQVYLCSLLQGQHIVVILQQYDSLACQFPGHLPAGLPGLLRAQVQRLGAGSAANHRVQVRRHESGDGGIKHPAGRIDRNGHRQQQRTRRQPQLASPVCFFHTPYRHLSFKFTIAVVISVSIVNRHPR